MNILNCRVIKYAEKLNLTIIDDLPSIVNPDLKIEVNCLKHGKFDIIVKKFIRSKYGCPQCRREEERKLCLEKYGVENPSQSNSVKEKIKETNLKKYGGTSPAASEKTIKKMKNTSLIKYGVDNPAKSDIIKEKTKETGKNNKTSDFKNTSNFPLITFSSQNKAILRKWFSNQAMHNVKYNLW